MAITTKRKTTKKKAAAKKVAAKKVTAKKEAAPKVAKDDESTLSFGDSLTITEVAEWHERVTDVLKSNSALRLDGSEIEQVDGAGMQLLAAMVKEALTLHISVEWSGASEALLEAANQSGLGDLLQLGEINKAA